jgi:hypothetical protein
MPPSEIHDIRENLGFGEKIPEPIKQRKSKQKTVHELAFKRCRISMKQLS